MPARRVTPAWLLMTLLIAGAVPGAVADGVYVACHAGVLLDRADVRDVFLGEKRFALAVRLVPVDNAAARGAFVAHVLQMDELKYDRAWTKKSFREGVFPPPLTQNDAEALALIRSTPGACGYLAAAPPPGVTVIGRY